MNYAPVVFRNEIFNADCEVLNDVLYSLKFVDHLLVFLNDLVYSRRLDGSNGICFVNAIVGHVAGRFFVALKRLGCADFPERQFGGLLKRKTCRRA